MNYEIGDDHDDYNNIDIKTTTKYVVDSNETNSFYDTLKEAMSKAEDGDTIAEVRNIKKVKIEKKLV